MKTLILEPGASTQRPSSLERIATEPVKPPSVLRDLVSVFLLFLALRGALFAFDYAAKPFGQFDPKAPPIPRIMMFHPYWSDWARWDAGWYMRLVTRGYEHVPDLTKEQSNVAFLPLYPWLVRALSVLTGPENHWYAGIFISNLSTALGLFFMLRIGRRFLDEDGAWRGLAYLLLFPSSFWFSAYYTEGLFFLASAASFYYFFEKKYFWCGVWGYLAALTRNPGMLLFPSFVLGWLWENRARLNREDLRSLIRENRSLFWLGLIPCGLLTFMGILYYEVGDPLAFFHCQTAWARHNKFFLRTLWDTLVTLDWRMPYNVLNMVTVLDFSTCIVFLVLPFLMLRSLDLSMAVFCFLATMMPLFTGSVASMMRYELAAFPAFFLMARWGGNRSVDRCLVSIFTLFLGLLTFANSNCYFIG